MPRSLSSQLSSNNLKSCIFVLGLSEIFFPNNFIELVKGSQMSSSLFGLFTQLSVLERFNFGLICAADIKRNKKNQKKNSVSL